MIKGLNLLLHNNFEFQERNILVCHHLAVLKMILKNAVPLYMAELRLSTFEIEPINFRQMSLSTFKIMNHLVPHSFTAEKQVLPRL